jgi:putative salt-induced outer membrane protein
MRRFCFGLGLLTISISAMASSAHKSTSKTDKIAASPWTGNISFGFVGNTGNTDTNSLDGAFGLKYKQGPWEGNLNLTTRYAASSGETKAERYSEAWQSRYYLGEKELRFLFAWFNGIQDRFATYNQVYSYAVGYGWRLLDTKTMHLDLQVGPGQRFSQIAGSDKRQDDTIIFGNATYHWQFTEKTAFDQTLRTEYGEQNHFYESVSSIKTNLIGNLGLDVSYTVRYNSDIPKESKNKHNTDTITSVNLIYSF